MKKGLIMIFIFSFSTFIISTVNSATGARVTGDIWVQALFFVMNMILGVIYYKMLIAMFSKETKKNSSTEKTHILWEKMKPVEAKFEVLD